MMSNEHINRVLVQTLKIGIVALILSVPLFYAPWFLFPFVFGKAILLHLGVEFLLIVWFVLAQRDRTYLPQPSVLTWAYLLFVGWMLLASALGINFERSFWSDPSRMTGLFTLFHVAALALMVERVCAEGFRDVLVRAVGVSGTIAAVLGFVLDFFARYTDGIYTGFRGRIVGLLGNPIYFAVYLVPIIFVTAHLAFRSQGHLLTREAGKARATQWLWRVALAVQILALAFAGSRGGLVGLVLGVVAALVIFLIVRRGGKIWMRAGLILGALVLVVGGLFVVGRFAGDTLPPQISKLVLFSPTDITTNTRLLNWRIAYRAARARPWTGWGAENYRDAFDRHFDPTLLKFSFYESVSDKPHNSFIEILVAGGIVGFLLYLGVAALTLTAVLSAARRGRISLHAAAFVGGALVAYWGSGFFAFDSPSSLMIFGVMLGWVGSLAIRTQKSELRNPRVGNIIFGVATCALLVLSPFGNVLPLGPLYHASEAGRYTEKNAFKWFDEIKVALASRRLYRDEIRKLLTDDFLQWQARGNFPATFAPQAFGALSVAMRDSTTRHPEYFTWHFLLAQMDIANTEEGNVNQLEEARRELDAARAIAPRHQAVYMLAGRLALLERDLPRAIRELQSAVALDPKANQPHWFLALVFAAAEREDDAIQSYEAAHRLGKNFENRDEVLLVADWYAKRKNYVQLIEVFSEAIWADPEHAADWYARLAATYGLLGDVAHAEQYAREAVARDPAIGKEAEQFLQSLKKK